MAHEICFKISVQACTFFSLFERIHTMATAIKMRHPETGLTKKGLIGFSWTTLFFGGLPAIFRGDWTMGLILIVLGILTLNLSSIIAAFIYNKTYTRKLLESGYRFEDAPEIVELAHRKLGVSLQPVTA